MRVRAGAKTNLAGAAAFFHSSSLLTSFKTFQPFKQANARFIYPICVCVRFWVCLVQMNKQPNKIANKLRIGAVNFIYPEMYRTNPSNKWNVHC